MRRSTRSNRVTAVVVVLRRRRCAAPPTLTPFFDFPRAGQRAAHKLIAASAAAGPRRAREAPRSGAEDADTVFWLPLIVQTLFPKFEIPASREPHFKPSQPPAARRSPESEVEVRFLGSPRAGARRRRASNGVLGDVSHAVGRKMGPAAPVLTWLQLRNFLPRASATSLKTSPAAHWVNGQTPVSNRNKPSSSLRESNTKLGPQNGLPGHVKYNFLPRGV
ncbi:hypothetical protein DFH06DRAFT_1147745 [Mycena polygramma]|nr:hypothetical protein DFH06DRAFT_1147745 [Mycena polygramma]